jgi:hypothetical protein
MILWKPALRSKGLSAAASLLGLLLFSPAAGADGGFAEPPQQPLVREPGPEHADDIYVTRDDRTSMQPSSLRISVGPSLRVAESETSGGLYVALDIGARAAGVRASGAWIRAGAERGVSQYAAELWIDFGVGRELHPIIGAGAGVARVEGTDAAGDATTTTLGVGVLRGTLEYELPVAGVDARVGLDVLGSVPATPGGDSTDASPWLLAVGRVGVGF